MSSFHAGISSIANKSVTTIEDYSTGLRGLPVSDVVKFYYCGADASGSVVVRPSGTEPKLKAYISVTAANEKIAKAVENEIVLDIEQRIHDC